MYCTVRGLSLIDLPDPARWVGVLGSLDPSEAECRMAMEWATMLASESRVVVSRAHGELAHATQVGTLSVPTGYSLTFCATTPEEPSEAVHQERLAHTGSLVYPFDTPAQSPDHHLRRMIEADMLLAQWVTFLIVVSDVSRIEDGNHWAVQAAKQRGTPVFRLNSRGVAYRNPPARVAPVSWALESPLWQQQVTTHPSRV